MSDSGIRHRVDLSEGWQFVAGRKGRRWLAGDGTDGAPVDLPHCWNARDTFARDVRYARGWGSYRNTFALTRFDASRWVLCSEGFYGFGDLWIDGKKVAEIDGAYLGLEIPLADVWCDGTVYTLGIRLSNQHRRDVLPGIRDPDFLLYGGLAGRIWLERRPAIHFEKSAVAVRCGPFMDGACEVRIRYRVHNGTPDALTSSPDVEWAILNERDVVASGHAEPARDKHEQETTLRIDDVRRWSPESPFRYQARGRLLRDGHVLDEVTVTFGCREAEFRPGQGFFLNGKRTVLRGVNRHESMPGFGSALAPCLHRDDAALIKSMGLNFVRLSHYPQHPAFLDACDELGLLVYAELASWKSVRGGRWLKAARRQFSGMIKRDRNHPCIIAWGMGNESRSRRAYLDLRELAGELDPGRPVSYAENHLYRARRQRTTDIVDVWGLNYEWDVVGDAVQCARQKNVIVTECSNYPHALRGNRNAELRQVSLIETDLARIEARADVAGFALWCFNDYATERKNRFFRHCGLVDAWRLPKMSAALLTAMYGKALCVTIYGSWTSTAGEPVRTIHVFSNGDVVGLKLNGRPLQSLTGAIHYTVAVPFEEGMLTAVARGNGEEETATLVSHGSVDTFTVQATEMEHDSPGRLVRLDLTARDRTGQWVMDWQGSIHLAVKARGRLLYPHLDSRIAIEAGLGRVYLYSQDSAEAIRIVIDAAGLPPCELPLSVQPAAG